MSAKENTQSLKVLDDLMSKLTISKDAAATKEATNALASFINGRIEDQDAPEKTVEALKKHITNKKDAALREKAALAIQDIAQHSEVGTNVEPYLVVLLPFVLGAIGDKITGVKNAATAAAMAIMEAITPNAVKAVLPTS
ncbi:elongation factor 3 [Apiospora kogelbergensis]|uniref:elongation factor 3 n=1 Tax=Apiospora kogelbergensis TaxID=1337665 RepID=UPI00312FFBD4